MQDTRLITREGIALTTVGDPRETGEYISNLIRKYEKLLEPILKMKQQGRIPCDCMRVQGTTCGWLCANIHPDYYKLPPVQEKKELEFDEDF